MLAQLFICETELKSEEISIHVVWSNFPVALITYRQTVTYKKHIQKQMKTILFKKMVVKVFQNQELFRDEFALLKQYSLYM